MAKYTVASVEQNTPTIIRLVLKRRSGEKKLVFLPGQYASISFYSGKRPSTFRCFSIASSPHDHDNIEFGIRVMGKYTQALKKLKAGNRVDVMGPFGDFVLPESTNSNVVFCSGGIGITPFMSMVRYAAEIQLNIKLTLVLSARSPEEIPYFNELLDLEKRNENLRVIYVLDSGDIPTEINKEHAFLGRLNKDVLAYANSGITQSLYYLCGPPPFMMGVTNMLTEMGVGEENIITEAFSQGLNHKLNNSMDWPATMYWAGAFGALVITLAVMTNEILKTITPTLLPEALTNEYQKQGTSSRQKDLDTLVNSLQSSMANNNVDSPAVTAIFQEVAAAEAKIAAQQGSAVDAFGASQTQSSVSSSSTSSSATRSVQNTTQPVATPTTPQPTTPPPPVCTTSASGVTTCQ